MREIHELLNTLGEEQNVTAQKTALNDEALSLLDLPRLSSYRQAHSKQRFGTRRLA